MTTILVIDDDEQIHSYLSKVLEEEGYGVRQARNGVEGIRAYQQEPADLIFCDLFMERKEGLEAIRQLLQEFPQAKIIAISGGQHPGPRRFPLPCRQVRGRGYVEQAARPGVPVRRPTPCGNRIFEGGAEPPTPEPRSGCKVAWIDDIDAYIENP